MKTVIRTTRPNSPKFKFTNFGTRFIGWLLIMSILWTDITYAMKSAPGAPMGEEAATSSSSHFSSRRRLVDTDEVENVPLKEQEQPLVVENTCSVTPAQFHSDLQTQTQAQSTRTGSPEEPKDGALVQKEEHLSSKESFREDPDPTQENKSSSTNLAKADGSPKRFRSDISTLSEIELASSAEQRVNHDDVSFTQFLMMFGMNDLDPKTHRSLAELWTLETSWRGTVRWVNIDSLLQKCGYVVGIRPRNVLTLRQPPEGIRCDRPLWVSGGSIPLLSQNNRRVVHFIDGLRQGTEFVIFRGLHLGITALAGYQLYEWLHQPPSLICHVSGDTSHTLRGLIDFYRNSDDNVLLSVFHDILDPSNPALSYLKYGLLTPFAFGLVKGGLNTRKNHMTPEEITTKLEALRRVAPSFYNDVIRWFFPFPFIDLTTGNLIKNLLWNGDLEPADLQRIVDTFSDLATSGRFYTSIHALGYLAPLVYGMNLHDFHKLSRRKTLYRHDFTEQFLPREEDLQVASFQEREALSDDLEDRIQKRLKLKAKTLNLLKDLASFEDKEGGRKGIAATGIALYAQYLLWSLGLSRSRTEALGHSLFKGGKLYVQVKLLQTIIDALLKAEQCPRQPGVTLAGVQPWAQDLTQTCFDAYVNLFNIIPGQPTDTLVGSLTQYYFPNCTVSLDLSNKAVDWQTIYNITKTLMHRNITLVTLNLSGNALGFFIDVEDVIRHVFSTLSMLTSLDLSNNEIGNNNNNYPSTTVALGEGIGTLRALTSLDLSQNWIGEWDDYNASGTVALGKGIGALRTLTFLDLSDNFIGSRDDYNTSGTMSLGKGISALKALTSLDLSHNGIGSNDEHDASGTMALGKGIGTLRSLTNLDLSSNSIDSNNNASVSGTVAMGEGIGTLRTLTSLDLSHNGIGYDDILNAVGTVALGKGMSALKLLTFLDLSDNGIGEYDAWNASGTGALGEGIGALRSLTFLNLSDNQIGTGDTSDPSGTMALGEGIGKLRKLTFLDFSGNRIGSNDDSNASGTMALGKGIGELRNLTILDLSNNEIGCNGGNGTNSFVRNIAFLHKLQSFGFIPQRNPDEHLCLSSSVIREFNEALNYTKASQLVLLISPEDVEAYCEKLPLSVQVVKLSKTLYSLETSAIQALMTCLKNKPQLTSLDLSHNWIGYYDFVDTSETIAFGEGVGTLRALTLLDLSHNWIGSRDYTNTSGTISIAKGIRGLNKTLTFLDLSGNAIGSSDNFNTSGTMALGEGIGNLRILTSLNLSGNAIGSCDSENASGTVTLGEGIGALRSLTSLDLSQNEIDSNDYVNASGTMALGEGIGALRSLTFLDLSHNGIGGNDYSDASGTMALGKGIGALKSLTYLDLLNNEIGHADDSNPSGTMTLGEGIGKLSTLTYLDLSNSGENTFGQIGYWDYLNASGTMALMEGIRALSLLKNLNLQGNSLEWTPSVVALANVLNSTRNLTVLNLGGNQIGNMGPEGPAALLAVLPNLPYLDLSNLDVSGMTNVSWTSAADVLQQLHSQQLMTACQNSRCFGGDVNPSSQGGNTGGVSSPQGRRFAAEYASATPFQQRAFVKRKSLGLNVPEADISTQVLPLQLVRQPLLHQGNATLATTHPTSASTRLLQEQAFDAEHHSAAQRQWLIASKAQEDYESNIGFMSSHLFVTSAAKGAVTSVIPDIVSDVFEASGYSRRISKGMATLAQLEIVAYTTASMVPTLVGTTVRVGLDWLGAPARTSLIASTTASIATGVLASGADFDQTMLLNTTIALAGSYVGSACALKAKDWVYSLWGRLKTEKPRPAKDLVTS